MLLYKLTNEKDQTYNNTQWGEGITHTAPGKDELCSNGWIHAYELPELAVLMNPIHAAFNNPQLWEADGIIEKNDNGLKCGVRSLTTLRKIPLPIITLNQKIAFGILCSLEIYKEESFIEWANNWLSGKDRSTNAANAANAAAYAAANAANAAANAAYVAANAANAAYVANAAAYVTAKAAAKAAYAADVAANAAAKAAVNAANGAANAAYVAEQLNFKTIIEKALIIQ